MRAMASDSKKCSVFENIKHDAHHCYTAIYKEHWGTAYLCQGWIENSEFKFGPGSK